MFQAFTNYLVYTAPDDAAVREATFWMLGGLGSAKWEDLPLLALILPPLFLVLMALARPLNAMLMGTAPPSPWGWIWTGCGECSSCPPPCSPPPLWR